MMQEKQDGKLPLWLSELVATRLCHDLAGPIGGINNGVEFLAEGGEDAASGATELLLLSATEARAKLQFFRMAYGVVHAQASADPREMHSIAQDYFKNSKIVLAWEISENTPFTGHMRRLLANMMLVAASVLIMGGQLEVVISGGQINVKGVGTKVKQEEDLGIILKNPLDAGVALTSKHAPAALLSFYAGGAGNLHYKTDEKTLLLSVNLSSTSGD